MKIINRVISKFHVLLIVAVMLIIASSPAYSFTTGGGIYGKCDMKEGIFCQSNIEFRLSSGLCVKERDWGWDDSCCVDYETGVVLDKNGRLSDIQTSSCDTGDRWPDNGQGVLDAGFRGSWGFGVDVLVDYNGEFVLCDQDREYPDSRGGRWRCEGGNWTGPITTEDCQWGAWNDWGSCSVSCNGGTQTQTRTCGAVQGCIPSNDCSFYGQVDVQSQPCNAQACPCIPTVTTCNAGWVFQHYSNCNGKNIQFCTYGCSNGQCNEPPQSYCGDGVADSGEQCDGDDYIGNDDCIDYGYDGGTRNCFPSNHPQYACKFDDSQCTNNPSCSCSGWSSQGCGQGGCSSTQRLQTQSCSPGGCSSESRCIADSSCGNECTPGEWFGAPTCAECAPNGDYYPTCSNWGPGGDSWCACQLECTGSNTGSCIPCASNQGQSCGNGGTIQCDGSCSNPCASNQGQSCGNGGTIQCDGSCSIPCSSNQGQSCNCNVCGQCGGTIQCNSACSGSAPAPSPCAPGQAQCSGDRYQICSGSCQWQNGGTNTDGDSKDYQCGDFLCDNTPGIYDITRSATDIICTDSIDNDCDGLTDCQDTSDCHSIPRKCKRYAESLFRAVHKRCIKSNFQDTNCQNVLSQIKNGIFNGGIFTSTGGTIEYLACDENLNDVACCSNPDSCGFNGQCYTHTQKATTPDIDNDGVDEICIVESPGEWGDEFETFCEDGIDNDFDGLTDVADHDCDGDISGKITAQVDNSPLIGTKVSFLDASFNEIALTFTDQNGDYSITIPFGTYDIIASLSDYVSQGVNNQVLGPREELTINLALVLGTTCEVDCTYTGDNTIHKSCSGRNGCSFIDSTAENACDLAQPGWERVYDADEIIECSCIDDDCVNNDIGPRNLKSPTVATITCEGENLIKLTRIVIYKGKPVNMVITVCG